MPPSKAKSKEQELLEAFKVFDTSGDGALDLSELKAIFQRPTGNALTDEQVQELFDEFDANGDGVLEFSEFSAFWTDSFGEAGTDLLRDSVAQTKKMKKPPKKDKASLKSVRLESVEELQTKLTQEQQAAKELEDKAQAASKQSFESRLGSALIRNDKGSELKAGKLDKYLNNLIRSWDNNADGSISLAEFRLAVRTKPLNVKADNKEIDACFKSFDKDNSGDLELQEMKPFLKALQKAAFDAEAEASSSLQLAAAMRDRAEKIEEAMKTMKQLNKLKDRREGVLAATPLPVLFANALNTPGKRVKMEDAPHKIFGSQASKEPEATSTEFLTGVLKALSGANDKVLISLGDQIQEKVGVWFNSSLVGQGSSSLGAHPKLQLRPVLQRAFDDAAEFAQNDEARAKEIEVLEKRAKEQHLEMAIEDKHRSEKEADARAATNAKLASQMAAESFQTRGMSKKSAEQLATKTVLAINADLATDSRAGHAKVAVRKG